MGKDAALIAVDIGNTTVSLGYLVREKDDCVVVAKDRFPTADGEKGEVIARALTRLTESAVSRLSSESGGEDCRAAADEPDPADGEAAALAAPRVRGVVVSSVVPRVTETVKREAEAFCRAYNAGGGEEDSGELPVVEITTKSRTGLIFRGIDMSTLGHDRIVDAAWAAANVPLPAVTVDMGTATTFNVIDEGGIFLGGMICAGIRTGLWGLNQRTAALPIPKEREPNGLIGKKTVDCLLSGAYNGSAAMIDGLVSRIEEELGRPVTLVMTGGHAITVRHLCRHEVIYEPNLLHKGLAILFEKNVM